MIAFPQVFTSSTDKFTAETWNALLQTWLINGVSFSGFNGCLCLLQLHFMIHAAGAFLHKILISAAARQLGRGFNNVLGLFCHTETTQIVFILLAYMLFAPFKKSPPHPFSQLDICLSLSFFPSSIQPSIHACSCIPLLPPPISTIFFCSFLLVIHLWQPTPPSHTSSLSICCSLSHPRHTPLVQCLPLYVLPTHTHTLQPLPWHLSTVVFLHNTYFVFPHCAWYQMLILQL